MVILMDINWWLLVPCFRPWLQLTPGQIQRTISFRTLTSGIAKQFSASWYTVYLGFFREITTNFAIASDFVFRGHSNAAQIFFVYFFVWLELFWPLLCLCGLFCIFERCQDSNPEKRRATNLVIHPSSYGTNIMQSYFRRQSLKT